MIATESDANSFEYANRNVSRNSLEDRIKIIKINSGGKNDPLVPESVLKRFERWVLPDASDDLDLSNYPFRDFGRRKQSTINELILITNPS